MKKSKYEINGNGVHELTLTEKEAELIGEAAIRLLNHYDVPIAARGLIGLAVLANGFPWIERVSNVYEEFDELFY